MSKYIGEFKLGWMTLNADGECLNDLVEKIEKEQDLDCLCQMAGTMGTRKDQKEVKKLVSFLDKYRSDTLSVDDVRNLDVQLSAGHLKCMSLVEQDVD